MDIPNMRPVDHRELPPDRKKILRHWIEILGLWALGAVLVWFGVSVWVAIGVIFGVQIVALIVESLLRRRR